MIFNTISVIGLGYIGLPTAAVLATKKINVIGVDINQHAVDTINRGEVHIIEPGLDLMVHTAVAKGYLRATATPERADAFIVAVPTPIKIGVSNSREPDLSYIESASRSLAPVIKKGDLIILESTSPVGTTEKMAEWISESRPDLTFPHTHGETSDIRIAYCPERVLPGKILVELTQNDRVIGGITSECSKAASQLYKTFLLGDCIITNARTAEMCKLTENSFRDVNIAFANELSMICDQLDVNVWELIKLANHHPRVNILQPGPGVGGHCIAVDPWFIISATPEQAHLIRAAREVNDSKPQWVIAELKAAALKYLSDNKQKNEGDIKIACYGLTFKPDIDDLRESPALEITELLAQEYSGRILVIEPHISFLPNSLQEHAELVNHEEAQKIADINLILVRHAQFIELTFTNPSRKTVDACGLFSADLINIQPLA